MGGKGIIMRNNKLTLQYGNRSVKGLVQGPKEYSASLVKNPAEDYSASPFVVDVQPHVD
jgi:hypothetical protein